MTRIIPREEWGARPPRKALVLDQLPRPRAQLHHSAGARGGAEQVRRIQADHQGRGWRDIAYNVCITGVGVYEGIGTTARHLNTDAGNSMTFLLVGNYDEYPVPDEMIDEAAFAVAHSLLAGWIADELTGGAPHLVGHRDIPGAKPTACPGRYAVAVIPEINRRAASIIHTLAATEADDMASNELLRFFARPDGTIPANWHSGAEALLSLNHNVSVLLARQAAHGRDLTALAAAVAGAATPDEVLGIVQAALEPLVEAIDGLDVTGTPGTAADAWQIIRDLAVAQLEGST